MAGPRVLITPRAFLDLDGEHKTILKQAGYEIVANPWMAPAMSGCPNGWLAWEQPFTGYTPTGVYYYAPTAVGSYKVLVQGQIMDQSMSQKVDFQGSSIVTVTVTAQ